MTILIIGGTGKTGLPLAKILNTANYPVLVTSRSGNAPEPFKAVAFDWLKASTFENPFNADPNIDRVYVIGPTLIDPMPFVKPFIDLAISRGVKRFVLLSATDLNPEGIGYVGSGRIHKYLLEIGINYAVLRPTWFMENFSTSFCHSIRENNEVVSATEGGLIPFISVEDIAQAAFNILTAENSPNKDYLVLGSELHSYDQAVKILSAILGREITHRRVTAKEQEKLYIQHGWSPDYAKFMASIEVEAAGGSEERQFNAPAERKILGKHTLREYFESNRAIWIN